MGISHSISKPTSSEITVVILHNAIGCTKIDSETKRHAETYEIICGSKIYNLDLYWHENGSFCVVDLYEIIGNYTKRAINRTERISTNEVLSKIATICEIGIKT